MKVDKGFIVLRNGKNGKKPRVVHPTLGIALVEAHRLAEKTAIEIGDGTGAVFLIAEIIGGCQVIDGVMYDKLPE